MGSHRGKSFIPSILDAVLFAVLETCMHSEPYKNKHDSNMILQGKKEPIQNDNAFSGSMASD